MAASSMNIRMDSEVKSQAQALFAQFGLDMTSAVNMFLRQSIRENRIPFELRLQPDYSLEKAMRDSMNRENLYGPYATVEEAIAAMLEDDEDEEDNHGYRIYFMRMKSPGGTPPRIQKSTGF